MWGVLTLKNYLFYIELGIKWKKCKQSGHSVKKSLNVQNTNKSLWTWILHYVYIISTINLEFGMTVLYPIVKTDFSYSFFLSQLLLHSDNMKIIFTILIVLVKQMTKSYKNWWNNFILCVSIINTYYIIYARVSSYYQVAYGYTKIYIYKCCTTRYITINEYCINNEHFPRISVTLALMSVFHLQWLIFLCHQYLIGIPWTFCYPWYSLK